MQIGRIEGTTRVLGKSQGYLGLPIRDEITNGCPMMTSAWLPTPNELAALIAGAAVHVCILGTEHPLIKVVVGSVPE